MNMKKNNMLGVWLTTITISALAASAAFSFGQQAPAAAAVPAGGAVAMEMFAPRQGEWKVEDGLVIVTRPGKGMTQMGDGQANLGNAIKALTMLYPDASFALDPRLAKTKVGDLLNRVEDPLSELKALRVATGGAFDIEESGKLFALAPAPGGAGVGAASSPRMVVCFNLQGYLSYVTTAARHAPHAGMGGITAMMGGITTNQTPAQREQLEQQQKDAAIDRLRAVINKTIQSVDSKLEQPEFQYFEDGQMLIATGPNQALQIASHVIRALPGMEKTANDSADRQRQATGSLESISPIERLFKSDDARREHLDGKPESNDNSDPAKPGK